jgi:pantoate--beta-alanine ligase
VTEVVDTIAALRERLDAARAADRRVGFVPTMGYLHDGHTSLVDAAVAADDLTVVSIFVNPLQFAEGEDLADYPRDLEADLVRCRRAGADLVFAPSVEEMYPRPIDTVVTVPATAAPLEGVHRPTHFAGVATVVAKLFAIVGPCRAYFGAKDWQQVAVVRRMVADLSIPVEVVACPTVREPDGLAMSSRNVYLSPEERTQAPVLRRALDTGLALVEDGETDPTVIEATMREVLAEATLGTVDYAAAVPADTLVADGPLRGEVRLLVAVRFGRARLIDNDGARSAAGPVSPGT